MIRIIYSLLLNNFFNSSFDTNYKWQLANRLNDSKVNTHTPLHNIAHLPFISINWAWMIQKQITQSWLETVQIIWATFSYKPIRKSAKSQTDLMLDHLCSKSRLTHPLHITTNTTIVFRIRLILVSIFEYPSLCSICFFHQWPQAHNSSAIQ